MKNGEIARWVLCPVCASKRRSWYRSHLHPRQLPDVPRQCEG